MAEEDIINNDCFYEKEEYNDFNNFNIYGLNIEGIKKYYVQPYNSKYIHMMRLKKDLEKIIENSKKKEQERKKKYDNF